MIPNPHDLVFKAVFGQPEHARGMLRGIVPAALAEALNWSTLALQPGSFVDVAFHSQHTDLLYSAGWRESGEALIYVLFEHQSAPPTEGRMAERMLSYQVRIWDRWRADHPKAKTLPMILPIVMYHGASPWPEPRSFDQLLEVPAALRPALEPYLVRFSYLLHDLSQISDDELREGAIRTALAKLVAMCFKYARTRADFIHILGRWMDVAREVVGAPHGLQALALVMRYILEVSEHVEPEELQRLLEREIGPEAKDVIMTAAQRLIEQGRQQGVEQGRQQGVEQGRQQGVEQGRQQGVQGVLLRLLRQRFGDAVNVQVEQRIVSASLEQVEAWAGRVLSAPTLAELLAD
ncbi:MAG TPA: Rpn family recombination-promoting nuclease/putative transposase [Kofleriaceae bacterium]|jgi:predicted transposase/invertase (TIGR01784 family)|nr:Rpn family recombination-promoting nuclease/putative transposase [Kofleriaceae bacterium]